MTDFEYKSLLEQRKMATDELQEYFILLRKAEYERQTLYDMKIRKKIYRLIKFLLKINRLLEHRSIKVIKDAHYSTTRGKIYVCTSAGKFDIPIMIEIVNTASWTVMSGNPSEEQSKALELILRANFLTFVNDLDENSKRIIENRLYKNLATGGTEICFPENVYLRTQEDEVAELNYGFVKRTVETNSSIIPVAISCSQDGKQSVMNIGKNLELGDIKPELYEDVEEIIRADLQTLKKEIKSKTLKREN